MNLPAQPQTLGPAGIAARVPHSGSMCLLHTLRSWSAERIECSALSHRDPANPLRTAGVLLAANAIEYAAHTKSALGTNLMRFLLSVERRNAEVKGLGGLFCNLY